MNTKYKIFLATGGSGGHIFPAISLAEKLIKNNYNICICADEIYEKYSCGLNYRIIKTGKTLKSYTDIKNIILGFFQAIKLILQEKPHLVVAFGCYATLPILLACIFTKTPFLLHEQNMFVGKINKLFARFSVNLMTSFHELYGLRFKDMNKVVYTGSPVREDIKELYKLKYLYPRNEDFNVLITGGSGGARIFSEYLPKMFDLKHKKEQENIMVYHQVREEYVENVSNYYKSIGLRSEVKSFFYNINDLLKKAHLIIGRAGSGTIFEIAIAEKPSILIPLSTRSNNRQIDNVKFLSETNSSKIVLEKDFDINNFREMFFDLIKDKDQLEKMAKNIRKLAVIDADENILKIIKSFLKDGK